MPVLKTIGKRAAGAISKKAVKALGKKAALGAARQAKKGAIKIAKDISRGKPIKQAIKQRSAEVIGDILAGQAPPPRRSRGGIKKGRGGKSR